MNTQGKYLMRPTIKDVGRLAGVSIGTVSNVINGQANVTPQTREKVERAIEQLGYRANRAARSLPAGKTGLLGYRMPGSENFNMPLDRFLHALVEEAGKVGLEVLLFTPNPEQTEMDAYQEVLTRGGVDAFVLSGIDYENQEVDFLAERGVPFAAFGRAKEHERSLWVDIDGAEGTRLATEHLLAHHRQRIAFLGWPEGSLTGDERCRGWQAAMAAAGLDHGDDYIWRAVDSFEAGHSIAEDMAKRGFDAAVCVTDTMALGLLTGLRELGIRPGIDFLVSGFDDVAAAELVSPGLTSIRQPMETVARELVVGLYKILCGEQRGRGRLVVPQLVVRGSTETDP